MIANETTLETQPARPGGLKTIPTTVDGEIVDTIYLLGRPPLAKFLRLMAHEVVNGAALDEGVLTDEWRAASHHIRVLEKDEAGIADNPSITKLDSHLESLYAGLLKDPLIVHGFNTLPTNVGMIELDQLVVYQKHIDLAHVRQLKEKLGPTPGDADIFKLCLPSNREQPPAKWLRAHHGTFVFMSPSNDLRFLGALGLESGNIVDCPPPGALVGVVGLAVGFGSNFLNAIYSENRLVLHNGSHRAYALRELGIKRAPCIIQYAFSRDELDAAAAGDLHDHPDLYLRTPRPPMLKDYFDPKVRKIVPVRRRLRQVTVKFEVDEAYVPAF